MKMINQEDLVRLKEIISSCLNGRHLELVEITYDGRRKPVLTMLIDRPEGGVTVEECALANRMVSEALDAAHLLNSGYILEVSSPGVDRPLQEKSDFLRAMNKKVRCFLKEPLAGKGELAGVIKEVSDDGITLSSNEGSLRISYANINKAKQIID